jgi:hypothetical protein
MDGLIMMREEGDDNTICTFLNRANRNTRPLGRVLRRRRVSIVPSTKEEDAELDMYWELGIVGVVVKNRVVFNLGDETVKGLWLNPELATKTLWAMNPPVI